MMLISNCVGGHRRLSPCDDPSKCTLGSVEHSHCRDCPNVWADGLGWHYPAPAPVYRPGTAEEAEAQVRRLEAELERWRSARDTAKAAEEEMERVQRQRAEESAAAHERVLEQAKAQWRKLISVYFGNPGALAVLEELHRPDWGPLGESVVCAHCVQHNGYEDVESSPWPCATYSALDDARAKFKMGPFQTTGTADDDD